MQDAQVKNTVAISIFMCIGFKNNYTTLTNLSTKYLTMCKVYTDVGGIK